MLAALAVRVSRKPSLRGGDVIYDIEQGFPVAPKGQFILKHQQVWPCNARPCGGHSPVKVCLCSIFAVGRSKSGYQDSSGFSLFFATRLWSYATFCFSVAAK